MRRQPGHRAPRVAATVFSSLSCAPSSARRACAVSRCRNGSPPVSVPRRACRSASQLELTRGGERADIESGVLRRMGSDGIVVTATVAPCRQALAPGAPVSASATGSSAAASPPSPGTDPAATPARACTEAEASPVTLCATIPGNASVSEVALFSRAADSEAPWSASRYLPGQESGEARFAATYSESTPEAGARQVCQGFAHWSTDHARVVRMVVRYTLPA